MRCFTYLRAPELGKWSCDFRLGFLGAATHFGEQHDNTSDEYLSTRFELNRLNY